MFRCSADCKEQEKYNPDSSSPTDKKSLYDDKIQGVFFFTGTPLKVPSTKKLI